MSERTVILHYHLFKNAGTSIDKMLQANFGDAWVTREFAAKGQNNTADVVDWIKSTPDAVAFSSHTMQGPTPTIDGVRILTVLMLRDPIARIRSAYRFERTQQADTFGSVLARHTDFEGYVRSRLALPYDRQCRNFQTARLCTMVRTPGSELDRAREALKQIAILGLVEEFDAAVNKLGETIRAHFPAFEAETVHANRTRKATDDMDDDLASLLKSVNADDYALIDAFHDIETGVAG